MYLHRASWHSSATLTEVIPCFFVSCKANLRVKPAKMGTTSTLPKCLCCSVYCVFVCKCVLCYCHRGATQLQLTNISISFIIYHIIYHIVSYHIIPFY